MSIAKMPSIIMFMIFLVWFSPLVIYIIMDFIKNKRFYDDITGIIDKLDKKCLLPEVIKSPNYYEGKIIISCVKSPNQVDNDSIKTSNGWEKSDSI